MRSASIIVVCLVVLFTAGMFFEQEGRRADHIRYPRIGQPVDIGGRSLNLYCSGEGQPTVLFETFSHMAGLGWSAVQARVAEFTRACWYDRAGYGWSDPGPLSATMKSTAQDLHALAVAAHLALPFVFVGVGDAASELRIYHSLYPSETAGAVLANANGARDDQDYPESAKGPWARNFGSFAPRAKRAACFVFPVLSEAGGLRLAFRLGGPRRTPAFDVPPDQQAELDFLSDNPTANRGGNMCSRSESADEVPAGNLGDLRLIVLAPRDRLEPPDPREQRVAAAWNGHQREVVQPGIAALSTRGRLILTDGPVQSIAIVDAVREVVAEARHPQ